MCLTVFLAFYQNKSMRMSIPAFFSLYGLSAFSLGHLDMNGKSTHAIYVMCHWNLNRSLFGFEDVISRRDVKYHDHYSNLIAFSYRFLPLPGVLL